jgi:phosphate transport system ATP-binding protein
MIQPVIDYYSDALAEYAHRKQVDPGNPIIETRKLTVTYDNYLTAVRELSIKLFPHKITSIIGPSGCGKSTFLRALNRLHDSVGNIQVKGSIFFHGQDITLPTTDAVMTRKRIGLILQRPNPFPHLSIFDNVAAGLKLTGLRKKSVIKEVVEQAMQKAAIWDELKDRLKYAAIGLSSGQQQRLCIARSLAVEPEVLLMDEPTSALDPVATQKIEDLLSKLKNDITIIMVTHSMNQAARISDWTAFMIDGQIAEYSPTDILFTNPKLPITMDYLTGKFE